MRIVTNIVDKEWVEIAFVFSGFWTLFMFNHRWNFSRDEKSGRVFSCLDEAAVTFGDICV